MNAWDIKVNEQAYHVEYKGSKVLVNGSAMKLKNLKKERKMHYGTWEIPLGDATALLYGGGWLTGPAIRLVKDGIDVGTGEAYRPIDKVPAWAYIFIVLHAINFINGAIGVALAIAGISLTTSMATKEKMPLAVKILLSLLMVVVSYAIIFGIAFGFAVSRYY